MSEIHLIKQPGGRLIPANDVDMEVVNKIKNGQLCLAKIVQPRNPQFLRKFFSLINFGYQYWEPEIEPVNGITPGKDSERFRKDVTILAGFRYAVVNIKGDVRWEAESIAFGNMSESRFNEVYSKVFDVIWEMVLKKVQGMTPDIVENTINEMLEYD